MKRKDVLYKKIEDLIHEAQQDLDSVPETEIGNRLQARLDDIQMLVYEVFDELRYAENVEYIEPIRRRPEFFDVNPIRGK